MHESVVRVEEWAAAHHDVVSARRAWRLGMPRQEPPRLARSGRWQRLLRGHYWTRPFGAPPPIVVLTAARLFAGGGLDPLGVIVGTGALRLRELPVPASGWIPQVVLPSRLARRQPHGLRYVWTPISPSDVEQVRGVPCLRTRHLIAALGLTATDGQLLAVADAALRTSQVAETDLTDLARRWPILGHADPLAESPFESHVRAELIDAGLPPPVLQHVISDARGFVARVDFAWPAHRLLVEADGAAAHLGVAALRGDLRRQNRLVEAGWIPLRFTWSDLGAIAPRVRGYLVQAARRAG